MNDPEDADLESHLARLRPADLPDHLRRRLRVAEPLPTPGLRGWWQAALRPWPLAYAGLLAAWLLILTLRLATPSVPSASLHPSSTARNPEPASLGNLSLDRAFLLTRNNPSDPWP